MLEIVTVDSKLRYLHGHCIGARQLSVYSVGPSQLAEEPGALSQLLSTLRKPVPHVMLHFDLEILVQP